MSKDKTRTSPAVASQRVADQIRDRIMSGHLPPGTRIIQDELAEELDTSRIPVREALRILQSTGLVTLESNRGAWVTKMDQAEYNLNYKIRERLEPLLITESLPNITDDDVDHLLDLQQQIESNSDIERFLALDRQLHFAMYKGHGGELMNIVTRLWDTTQHYRRILTTMAGADRQWVYDAEHRLLIKAIQDRDSTTAEHVLAMHIRRTRIELESHPEVFL